MKTARHNLNPLEPRPGCHYPSHLGRPRSGQRARDEGLTHAPAAPGLPHVNHAPHPSRSGHAACGRKIILSLPAHRIAEAHEAVTCNRCQGGHRPGRRAKK